MRRPGLRAIAKGLLAVVSGASFLYLLLLAGAYLAMRQPPERFGAIMSRVPMPVMMIVPFPKLWLSARAGHLSVGDPAPDFALPTTDHSRIVRISDEWRNRPVVLVFGSYT